VKCKAVHPHTTAPAAYAPDCSRWRSSQSQPRPVRQWAGRQLPNQLCSGTGWLWLASGGSRWGQIAF
jgi:hypothetical protein